MTDQELKAIGAAMMRACTDLPEGWRIRIDLECGAGDVELESPDGEILGLDLSGEQFSAQISAHIEYAIEFVQGAKA